MLVIGFVAICFAVLLVSFVFASVVYCLMLFVFCFMVVCCDLVFCFALRALVCLVRLQLVDCVLLI